MKTIIILAIMAAMTIAVVAFLHRNTLRSKSTEELRSFLRGSDWSYFRNSLIELRRRGEDIKGEASPVLHLLISESRFSRQAGWMILKEIYPEMAAQVPDYNFKVTNEVCKDKIGKILLACSSP